LTAKHSLEHFVRTYGDLLFDLCESVLRSSTHSQTTFRSILKKINSGKRKLNYSKYERSWVLKLAVQQLLAIYHQSGHRVSADEQIKLDATLNVSTRLKQFSTYFHRLLPEDQILLLLKDKYGIPLSEISAALGAPEGSLKIRRLQALRTLEDWLWSTR